ncbi:unnamed protein product [Urochloa humidicola]
MSVEPNPGLTTQPAETCRNYHESLDRKLPAVPRAGDGGETSSSVMAAQGGLQRPASNMLPAYDAGQVAEHRRAAEPLGHGGATGDIAQEVAVRRPKPSYLPPSVRLADLPPPRPLDVGPGGLPLPPPGSSYCTRLEDSSNMATEPAPPGSITPPNGVGIAAPIPMLPRKWGPEPSRLAYRRHHRTLIRHHRRRHKKSPARYLTACCLLSCLLALAIGFALLVVYLRYDPRPPRMRVATATLDNSTIAGGRAHNYSLSVQVRIYNPNTQLHVVLRYMQLDLYFDGSLVGTQAAVWPAPIHEAPGDSVLRRVRLPVSVTREQDVSAWRDATDESGGIKPLVELLLVGRLHSQLNFGRRLPFRFWVHPRCTLWLDPLRGGALRQSSC